ncbi:MAG: ATP-binding cassette domain-containing protein [Chthoniobacteraceae bacterium]|nr:ATP-binding cassette domain-containing protein [Chthoniobacteraceae bacterium]
MRLLAIGVTQDCSAAGALCGAQLALAAGELHALLGPDGAGKSAFFQILGGIRRPAGGLLLLDSQPYAPASPEEARREGVWMAGTGKTLADGLTVEENLVLGAEPARRGWIDRAARRALACQALAELPGNVIPPDAPVRSLSAANRRRVEIARALLAPPRVLLVEDSWPFLPGLSGAFFAALRRLAERGTSVLYATRSVEAARTLCTRYTLLEHGGTTASGRTGSAMQPEAGAPEESAFPRLPRHQGRPLLQTPGGLTVHEGEILGVAEPGGLPRSRLLLGRGRAAARGGGILPGLSIADNLTLPCLGRFSCLGFLLRERQDTVAANWMQKLHLWARNPRQDAARLSAADRPKLLVGQLLLERAAVLFLEAPTRGLPAPAKAQIHALLQSAAAEGRGILVASADPAELLALCDTVALLRRGQPAECRPATEWTEGELAAALFTTS